MCGITGVINLNNKQADHSTIKKMNDSLAHRGPDDEGFLVLKNFALGQRRLSILDLSPLGHQPMPYDNEKYWIVFNGEVYNYLEIRDELKKKGYKFKSESDTEVILAAYKEWGPDCVTFFNGMWAFLIYDRRKNQFFGARDRIGVKPFYYYYDRSKFVFASEIKAILKHPEIKAVPNEKIVWDYLVCGLVDHAEDTFFKGVKELKAGHHFLLKGDKLKIKKYWDIDAKKEIKIDDEAASREFRELFLDSIKLRLRSDVPIGTCLSGGLDSSAIVCAVNEYLKKEGKNSQIGTWQKTFSSVFKGKKYLWADEQKFIKEVTKKTKAHSNFVFPSGKKLVGEIKDVIYHQDYPFCSTSIYAQWNVFRLASQNKVKVMLDGQGSDEFLAGYHPFFGIYFGELLKEGKIFRYLYESFKYSRIHKQSVFKIYKELFYNLARKGFLGKIFSSYFQRSSHEYDLFKKEWLGKFKAPAPIMPTKNVFRNGLFSGIKMGLPALLRYEDRDSMAFAIESRVPFLDYRLLEFIFSLPDNFKIRDGQTKFVMRQALKGILPEKIRNRQDKIGFATPEEVWMHEELGKEMKKVFVSEKFNSRGFFQKGKASKMFDEYLAGKNSNYQLFWRLYNYEMWMRVFIDK